MYDWLFIGVRLDFLTRVAVKFKVQSQLERQPTGKLRYLLRGTRTRGKPLRAERKVYKYMAPKTPHERTLYRQPLDIGESDVPHGDRSQPRARTSNQAPRHGFE